MTSMKDKAVGEINLFERLWKTVCLLGFHKSTCCFRYSVFHVGDLKFPLEAFPFGYKKEDINWFVQYTNCFWNL